MVLAGNVPVMSDIKKLLTEPGLTNAQVHLLNWMMLVMTVVEWTLCFFIADERTATRLVSVTTAAYSGGLLVSSVLMSWVRPGVQVERKRAWLVGVAGYGSLGLFLLLRTTMLALFG